MNDLLTIAKAYIEASGDRSGDFRKHLPAAKRILQKSSGDVDMAIERVRSAKKWFKDRHLHFSLYAILNHWHELQPIQRTREALVHKDEGLQSLKDIWSQKKTVSTADMGSGPTTPKPTDV